MFVVVAALFAVVNFLPSKGYSQIEAWARILCISKMKHGLSRCSSMKGRNLPKDLDLQDVAALEISIGFGILNWILPAAAELD